MPPVSRHWCLVCLVAIFSAACQRTLIQPPTDGGSPFGSPPSGLLSPTPERSATVRQIEGTVEAQVDPQAQWVPASQGLLLAEGSQIRTGQDGRALVLLTEGSKIRLGPATVFRFNILNPYLDSQLTSLGLAQGEVWVLLNGGALDVETPFGIASARAAYLSVDYDEENKTLSITCLQGTCSFGSLFVPGGDKIEHAERRGAAPEPMTQADFGEWGVNVPEATQLAFYATEARVQGSATLPVVPSATPTASPLPTPLSGAQASATSEQATRVPDTLTPSVPSAIPPPTPVPFTPLPPAPIIGRHVVVVGETLFCIARGYGVLPAAIALANGLGTPFTVFPGQTLRIPAVRWTDILPGPVCPPQFSSPYPGLPVATTTPLPTPTPAGPPLSITVNILCIGNCGSQEGDYVLRIYVDASGGVPPYTFNPGNQYDVSFPHCTTGNGTATVTAADGQTASSTWTFVDVSCPPTPVP